MSGLLIFAAIVSFLICFLLFLFVLARPSAEGARLERVTRETRRGGSSHGPWSWRALLNAERLAKPFGFFHRFFGSEADTDLTRRLMLAGYRKPEYADIFLGARLVLPALMGIAVAAAIQENTIFYFIMALVLGFFLPDLWLSYAVNKRRERIKFSLPDGLDLLSICLEAGLGLDQAIVRVGQELRVSHPELSEEFLQVNFEQRAGSPRLDAWKAFADRINVESARSFVAMLIQTDRFGTPVSKSLAAFSGALRVQRRQRAEELAAKTTIKLVLPLVLFIFPNIFIVTVGPAVLTIMRRIGHMVS